jgi:hypothetical protein
MVRFSLPPDEFLNIGLRLGGNWSEKSLDRTCQKTKEERLGEFFFVSKETMSELFEAIQDPLLGDSCIEKPNPIDFLAGLYFLKMYPKKSGQAGFAGCAEKDGLKKAWRYVKAFQALKPQKVSTTKRQHSIYDVTLF